jgi:hypothetical protein
MSGPVAMQVGPSDLGWLPYPLLVPLYVLTDGDKPCHRAAAAGFAPMPPVLICSRLNPFFHVLPQIRIGDIDPPMPQLGGHLLPSPPVDIAGLCH